LAAELEDPLEVAAVDPREVLRAREELEDLRQRVCHPLLALEHVNLHRSPASAAQTALPIVPIAPIAPVSTTRVPRRGF
jgi:hypothetical protein